MKKLIAPVIGIALVAGAFGWWMNRPHPDWALRSGDTPAAGDVEISILGRDGAEEKGALWVTCRGGEPSVGFNPGAVQFVGGGDASDTAYLNAASHFGDGPDAGRNPASVEIWAMPPGKGFFYHSEPAAYIRQLAASPWVVVGPSGVRSMSFHVRNLEPYRARVMAACGLDGPAA